MLLWLAPPVATSNSSTCGRVKLPHPAGGGTRRRYSGDARLAMRAAASFSRQLLPSNLSRWP
jgi:hypothetical protein